MAEAVRDSTCASGRMIPHGGPCRIPTRNRNVLSRGIWRVPSSFAGNIAL